VAGGTIDGTGMLPATGGGGVAAAVRPHLQRTPNISRVRAAA
jgi:hypothetical protein